MKINFAVDRLYESGWLPADDLELERLPNGLRYPTVPAIQGLFARFGMQLSLKPHLMFGCCRAEWKSAGKDCESADLSGTVVGSSDAEAAVFALAKFREQQTEMRLASAETAAQLTAV